MIFLILFKVICLFNSISCKESLINFTPDPSISLMNGFSNDVQIKVLLSELNVNDTNIWNISSKKPLILRNNKCKKQFSNKIEIKSIKNNFYLNNKKIVDKLIKIEPQKYFILKNNTNEYDGSFYLIKKENKLLLINEVNLEDYIFSVLYTESWPGWPLEVNKAFAIACRSYVIAKLLENRKNNNKNPYHIINSNKHQTYAGTHQSINLRKAVELTRGIILGFNKKPILAMYDTCCGGIIPAKIKNVNFKEAPYLARKKQCTFCQKCKLYSWQVDFNKNEFETILKKEFPKFNKLRNINIIKDNAGVVQKVEIKDKKNNFFLTGKKFYSLFKKTKSFCFSILKKFEKIIIKGKGYGHHLGICQWGARELVNRGWDYKSILEFYYPKTKLMKLQK